MLNRSIKQWTKIFKNRDKTYISLILILLIAFLIRAYALGTIPPGIYRDEALIGNLAYSVFIDGPKFPFEGHSVEMYATYIYSMLPFIKIFGLNAIGIRLASVLYGCLAIIVLFYLSKELFNEKVGLISSFLLAVSPIHLLYSRGSFEVISLVFYFSLFFLLLLKSVKNNLFLFPCLITAVLAFNTYATSRLFIPIFLLGFLIIYRNRIAAGKNSRSFVIFFILFVIALLCNLYLTRNTAHLTIYFKLPPTEDIANNPSLGGRASQYIHGIITSIPTYYPSFKQIYLKCVSYDFLFSSGKWNWPPIDNGPSMFYPFYIPLLLIGLPLLILKGGSEGKLILFWLVISPIPTSLTLPNSWDEQYARRFMSNATPVFEIISACAFYVIFCVLAKNLKFSARLLQSRDVKKIKPNNLKWIGPILFLIFVIMSLMHITSFIVFYFTVEPRLLITQQYWCYPAGEALVYAESVKKDYDRIVLNPMSLDTSPYPWIASSEDFILFYSSFRDDKYQRCPNIETCNTEGRVLYILLPGEVTKSFASAILEKTIYYSNGQPAFFIYSTK